MGAITDEECHVHHILCRLFDNDDDGIVGVNDLLTIISDFGPC